MTHFESSEAKKATAGAMSSTWPIRPSGVLASTVLRSVALGVRGGRVPLGLHHPRVDRVHPDLLRPQLGAQGAGDRIDRRLGGGVHGRVRAAPAWPTTELMLTTLPPAGPKCLTASWVVRISPRTFRSNCLWKFSARDPLQRGELVDPGVVHQHVRACRTPSRPRRTAA